MRDAPTLALTLWRPWAAAVLFAGKRVENRTWRPPARAIGQRVALHGGRRVDEHAVVDVVSLCPDIEPGRLPGDEGVVGLFTLVGWFHVMGRGAIAHEGIDADSAWRLARSPWFNGPVGWVLGDVRALPVAIPCRGQQGLWCLPAAVREDLAALLAFSPGSAAVGPLHQRGCRGIAECGGEYFCAGCGRQVGWCFGAVDGEHAELCDDCAAKARDAIAVEAEA